MQPVVDLPLPSWIVGDIHGNLHDLVRILGKIRQCPTDRIVFLGDYVDRGQHSLTCVLLLFALKCRHPETIVLLRGNHEFASTNQLYGFKTEVESNFPGSDIWEKCNKVFAMLPLAVTLGQVAICVHGGIGPEIASIDVIREIPLPDESYDPGDIVSEIVWSDPVRHGPAWQDSCRGRGCCYSPAAARLFLCKSGYQRLIRSHEYVKSGVETLGSTITVFSSSDYCGQGNNAAFLFIDSSGFISSTKIEPIPELTEKRRARRDYPFRPAQSKSVRPSQSGEEMRLAPGILKGGIESGLRQEPVRPRVNGSKSMPKFGGSPRSPIPILPLQQQSIASATRDRTL
jgi:protein phosphatase